jgi:crotonobetainyl-CoA:carnitine CoA-transferase CaiB-like acyl-CoA transferase
VGGPVKYGGIAKNDPAPPPLLGEHTATILSSLGYDESTIREFAVQGITKIA